MAIDTSGSEIGPENSSEHHNDLIWYALVSFSVAYVFYTMFYYFAPFIHSFNLQVDPLEITIYLRKWLAEHDGVETYVLYFLMFSNIILVLFVNLLTSKNNRNIVSHVRYKYFIAAILVFTSYLYVKDIGFHPPVAAIAEIPALLIVLGSVFLITTALFFMRKHFNNASIDWIIIVIVLPLFFIPSNPILDFDYNYIFGPALKILHGYKLSEIYFQYDFLLSGIAVIFMKLEILPFFYIVGQLSFYLFITGAFFFAKRFFINKTLPVYLLVSLLLVRFYAILVDPVSVFQVTPLRLDLWIILMILVYIKGPRNWTVGGCIGLLLLTHSIFGVIYLVSYSVLIFTLFLISVTDRKLTQNLSVPLLKNLITGFWTPYFPNFLIISGFIVVRLIIFGELTSEAGAIYSKIGFGMIPISPLSFYWHFPVVQSLSFILILRNRHNLTAQYVSAGVLLIFLSIGNSIYFFGRSHEHNILNISGVLMFLVFLLFDLFQIVTTKRIFRKAVNILPIIFIIMTTFYYSGRITSKVTAQYVNAANLEFSYRFLYPGPDINEINMIKEITRNSEKVFFLDDNDFWYYYSGNYSPPGRYQPCMAWVFKRDLTKFLQTLLDDDYYLVIHDYPYIEILPQLSFSSLYEKEGYIFVNKSHI